MEAFAELEQGVYAALETYSNVHRGSGHNSMITTHLYDQARNIILGYLGLNNDKYTVIFCTPRREAILKSKLDSKDYKCFSSQNLGLSIGVSALVVKRKSLPKGAPFQSGGGTTRLMSRDWVIWADAPERFEAGTPAIINVIAFAKAILMTQRSGKDFFKNPSNERLNANDILYHDELEKFPGQELLNELKKTLIGRGILVPTREGARAYTNLDNSASTPTFTPIWNAFRQTLHQSEQVKQEIILEVKSICAQFLRFTLADYDVIFTSNTTEAINLVAENLKHESEKGNGNMVINSILEHSSNDLPWRGVPNCSLVRLSVDADGFFDLNELESLLKTHNNQDSLEKKRIRLVAISGASNVLGVCNNIEEISRITHQYGARLLIDAAQLVAHRKVEVEACNVDYLTFSAHKVYAPFGCGVLVVKKGLLSFSSTDMQLIQSSGEENAGGIAALGKALVLLQKIGMDIIQKEEQELTSKALNGLIQIPGLKLYGMQYTESQQFANKIGVIVFSLKSKMSNRVAKELALNSGIGVRYGCHCAHIIVKHLVNMGPGLERFQRFLIAAFPKMSLPGLTRMSIGIENNKEDIDKLIHALNKISKKPQESANTKDSTEDLLPKKVVQQQIKSFINDTALKVYSC